MSFLPNTVLLSEVPPGRLVTVMTIADKQMPSSIRFFPRQRLKAFSQPIGTMLITCPPFRIVADGPVFRGISWYPTMAEILCFEDNARWKEGAVCTNTFDCCYPLLEYSRNVTQKINL